MLKDSLSLRLRKKVRVQGGALGTHRRWTPIGMGSQHEAHSARTSQRRASGVPVRRMGDGRGLFQQLVRLNPASDGWCNGGRKTWFPRLRVSGTLHSRQADRRKPHTDAPMVQP